MSEEDEVDEFYDAEDRLSPRSRGASLKSGASLLHYQTASQSLTLGQSLTLEEGEKKQILNNAKAGTMILPEEIEKELQELSMFDEDRRRRLSRLKMLQKGDISEEEHIDPNELNVCPEEESNQFHSPAPHFQLLDPEGRSLSESSGDNNSEMKKSPKAVDNPCSMQNLFFPLGKSVHYSGSFPEGAASNVIPDIVSSIQTDLSPLDFLDSMSSSQSKTSDTVSAGSGLPRTTGIATTSTSGQDEGQMPQRPPRKKKFSVDYSQSVSKTSSTSSSPLTSHAHSHAHSLVDLDPPALSPIARPSTLDPYLASSASTSAPRLDIFPANLPSPASAVASLTRDLETSLIQQQQQQQQQPSPLNVQNNQLNLRAAMRGQFVVKPQDDEKSRGQEHFYPEDRNQTTGESPRDESNLCEPPSQGIMSEWGGSGSFKSAFSGRSAASSLGKSGHSSLGAKPKSGQSSLSNSEQPLNTEVRIKSGHSSLDSRGKEGVEKHRSLGRASSHYGGKSRRLLTGGSMDSAGKSDIAMPIGKQMNMFFRTKSDSGKKLSDEEILKQVKVRNLDTGEEMDLVEAEDQIPSSINPLSLHIMRLTSEYVSENPPIRCNSDSDTESMVSSVSGYGKKKKSVMKKILGGAVKNVLKTTDAARNLAAEAALKTSRRSFRDQTNLGNTRPNSKEFEKLGRLTTDIKASSVGPEEGHAKVIPGFRRIQAHKSGPFDFENIQFAQELASQHLGPIWCMRFSHCGQLMATAGQDTTIRIWVIKDSYNYFKDMRTRYNADNPTNSSSPTNSYDNVIADQEAIFRSDQDKRSHVFNERPFCTYQGHTSDVLDICWSKNYFLLTSSMDKTVRLWHISRRECLCCFQHIDFVTALAFHPRNDQFFLSASLDGKLRLWNIPEKKVTLWNEIDGQTKLITAANFIQNGKFAVAGTYDGRCIFYSTDQLKYYTMIHVRSTRGKNAQGRKVTSIEPMPGEDKILVTTNDSRIRLYDLRDLSLTCKFKGYTNNSSQIRASFSHDGKYITSGSENQCIFLWKTQNEPQNLTARKDRNSYYEAIKAHNAAVTCSIFAPQPTKILEQIRRNRNLEEETQSGASTLKAQPKSDQSTVPDSNQGYVLVSGDFDGDIKVFYTLQKPKHSSLPSSAI